MMEEHDVHSTAMMQSYEDPEEALVRNINCLQGSFSIESLIYNNVRDEDVLVVDPFVVSIGSSALGGFAAANAEDHKNLDVEWTTVS